MRGAVEGDQQFAREQMEDPVAGELSRRIRGGVVARGFEGLRSAALVPWTRGRGWWW
ncbi:hypothetical protein ACIRG8_13000 [Streptomyces sp. NPDC102359]|uniref:hypothetical protein n=1 Tax=unclassified Streptomyces TaxID=2593676 RepID=UPI003808A1C8